MTAGPPARIVILGGGTAGWMAANLLATAWGELGTQVTLVESPDVGIIGVGEGSTPQLRSFFRTLGLNEADWMPRCNATYKNGITFKGWSERPGFESYYHPFATEIDAHSLGGFTYNTRARRTGRDVWAHPDRFFLPALLSAKKLGPIAAENFPFDVTYGYHFDAYLVGALLRDHAKMIGVAHLERHIAKVDVDEAGTVKALITNEGERIGGDYFIDCSGFRGTIIQEALGERFLSFADNLFNDSAVVMPTPADPTGTNPHTSATALSAGWAWDIPLTNRTGNGYVYASRYLDRDAAETELRAHLGLLDSETQARHLHMKVGRVERSWVGNCLAVGLSQGFIEPLEATALHVVQATVEGFISAMEQDGFTPAARDDFNVRIANRYEGIRDYIVCHYRVNRRSDTQYWRDNAANNNLSDTLKAVMTSWFRGEDLSVAIAKLDIAKYYSSLSWHCLLAGYGTFPDDSKITPPGNDIQLLDMAQMDDFLRRCALNFTDHKTLLDAMWANGNTTSELV
jgi:2-polyprenyl-6-methoxyphenol hydroxylase-like FAD-dependent oxidoreductase